MFVKEITKRLLLGPLTEDEISAINSLIRRYGPKDMKLMRPRLGERCLVPTNAYTGYIYSGTGVAEALSYFMRHEPIEECIGQFAGEKQWEKLGRKLIDLSQIGETLVPVTKYLYMGKTCKIYSYEQTEAA